MSVYNNSVYYATKTTQKSASNNNRSLSDKRLQKALEILSRQAIKEDTLSIDELESILKQSKEMQDYQDDNNAFDTTTPITKILKEQGYLCEKKNWLTNKGFMQIGSQMLDEIMKGLSSSNFGMHDTKYSGKGDIIMDSTRKFEPESDLKNINVPNTILNAVKRLSKDISFPLSLDIDDFEEYQTLQDVNAAVVYCIDLSSTMKYLLGKNTRIQAAKKALWSLYLLNKKFFSNDSIFLVGFASMASIIKPIDIPFLKTYDANDNFLHYTNYQAAFKLARKLLSKVSTQNKRIVLITDGQPSACFVENDYQKNEILAEKPYSAFYTPKESLISKIEQQKNMKLDSKGNKLVYLCYRHKRVDSKIDKRTLIEAKKCKRDGITIDSIIVSDEIELLDYVKNLERQLEGKTYHIEQDNIDKILVTDYLTNTKKLLNSKHTW